MLKMYFLKIVYYPEFINQNFLKRESSESSMWMCITESLAFYCRSTEIKHEENKIQLILNNYIGVIKYNNGRLKHNLHKLSNVHNHYK